MQHNSSFSLFTRAKRYPNQIDPSYTKSILDGLHFRHILRSLVSLAPHFGRMSRNIRIAKVGADGRIIKRNNCVQSISLSIYSFLRIEKLSSLLHCLNKQRIRLLHISIRKLTFIRLAIQNDRAFSI
jgi:hypothetical protein